MAASTAGKTVQRDLAQALVQDLEQIEDNASLYRRGRNSAYQAVAIQMRNLLLRGRRALLSRVLPDISLHPLRPSKASPEILNLFDNPVPGKTVDLVDVRGVLRITTTSPGMEVFVEFQPEPSMTVSQWLGQWIIRPDVKIGRLIEEVADEEVAHTEPWLGETVYLASQWTFGGAAAEGRELRHAVIVSLAEYVARRTRELMSETGINE